MNRSGLVIILSLATLVGGCSNSNDNASPTGPSSSTPSRIIGLSGDLAFGSVNVGSSRETTVTIANSGTQPLNVSGLSITGGLSAHTKANWTNGIIAAGASQAVRITFEPTSPGTFSGTLTVSGDQTGGVSTLPASGTGAGTTAAGTWSGRYVVERCDGTGSVQDLFCSANHGLYPVGTLLPINLLLTQSGSNVSGTVYFGQVPVVVTGVVSPIGVLTLQGAEASGMLIISSWNTPINGTTMTGPISFDVRTPTFPGVAAITARLSNVTR